MTFESAVNSLSNGKAAKMVSWGGYVRKDVVTAGIPEFSSSSTYTVGQLVRMDGQTYVCVSAVTTAGSWNSANWTAADKYTLTFRKRENGIGGYPVDSQYLWTPYVSGGSVRYKVEPDGFDSSGDESSGEFDDMLPLDGELLSAILSSEWTVGSADDFEAARTGSSLW